MARTTQSILKDLDLADHVKEAIGCWAYSELIQFDFKLEERSIKRLGGVNLNRETLLLHIALFEPAARLELIDTMLHEIAHFADFIFKTRNPSRPHGPTWQAWARMLGCTPSASSSPAQVPTLPICG